MSSEVKPISVLVSEPSHFRIVSVSSDLDAMQQLVGGYIEPVYLPGQPWSIYCNEEGKMMGLGVNKPSTLMVDALYLAAGRQRFSAHDVLVGPVIWMGPPTGAGSETSVEIDIVRQFASRSIGLALRTAPGDADIVITVICDGNDIWVYDQADDTEAEWITLLTEKARNRAEHGTIEVWTGVSPDRWVELRVELMDHYEINLHDERRDRSYG